MSYFDLFTKILFPSLKETLIMVFFSTLLATVAGFLLSIVLTFTKENGLKPNKIVYKFLDALINIIRSFPFIILIVAISPFTRLLVGTTIGIQAAIVPLTIGMAPFIARLFENNLNEVSPNLIEAAKSFGASNAQIFFKVIVVEAFPAMVASSVLSIISVLGSVAMAGTVGAGGLGSTAVIYGYQNFDDKILYSAVILLIVFVQIIQIVGNIIYRKVKKVG